MDALVASLDTTQLEAVNVCCDTKFRVVGITGEAGTGKTTILKVVYHRLIEAGYRVVLCAPTGKAAKRIFEATGIPAITIHRLLEYPRPNERDPKTGKFLDTTVPKRGKRYPLEFDVVLADEYMMVNYEVNRNLIDALPSGGCIRAFGDVQQLPPIENNRARDGLPAPFEEILNREPKDRFPSVRLNKIYRQGEGSGIVKGGHTILQGRIPPKSEDFTVKITERPVDALLDYVHEMREKGIDFATIDHQIITPTKKSWVGTVQLNQVLQTALRPETDGWFDIERHQWDKRNPLRLRAGDKIVWTENNYDLEIFNGETGIVRSISEYNEIEVDWGDRISVVPPLLTYEMRNGQVKDFNPQRSIDLAYALTTHRCQGSEYGHVVYILNKSSVFVQNRHNFYTAVTRGRQHVHVIADMRGLQNSCVRKTSMAGDKKRKK